MQLKSIILIFAIFLTMTPALAKNIKVQALSDFSTANPPETWSVELTSDYTSKNGYFVPKGSRIEGKIVDVVSPKRLKRNASFTFIPTSLFDSQKGETYDIKQQFAGKYSSMSDINAKSVAKQGAILAGNKIVDGLFGPGVALVEGAVQNKTGNRAKSAAVSLYESTPLSYANKGKEIEIKEGQVFVMSFSEL